MDSVKEEKKLLVATYLFCLLCFFNLFIIKNPFDNKALVIGVVICFLMGITYFIVRRFYPDGDKYILIFACILSSIGIVMIYRISQTEAIKQIIWFVAGIVSFIFIVVLLPNLKKYEKYKYVYLWVLLFLWLWLHL